MSAALSLLHCAAAQSPGCQPWMSLLRGSQEESQAAPAQGAVLVQGPCSEMHSPSTRDTAISKSQLRPRSLTFALSLLQRAHELSFISGSQSSVPDCSPAPRRGTAATCAAWQDALLAENTAQKPPLQFQECYFSHHSSLAEELKGKASFFLQISAHKYRLYCTLL